MGLLVDEAHNLIGRARAMHTVALKETDLQAAMDQAPAPVKRVLNQLARRAPFLKKRFAAAHASILFSGILNPPDFYKDLLGLREDAIFLDVPSPFSAEQLTVRIVGDISTRWNQRGASLSPIATLVANQFIAQPGNYLVFLSSFDYLENLHAECTRHYPLIPTWHQHRSMSENERRKFIDRFAPQGSGIGFAVLGGAFAEGIDLPGDRLIGAFIATLGLPQVNPVN